MRQGEYEYHDEESQSDKAARLAACCSTFGDMLKVPFIWLNDRSALAFGHTDVGQNYKATFATMFGAILLGLGITAGVLKDEIIAENGKLSGLGDTYQYIFSAIVFLVGSAVVGGALGFGFRAIEDCITKSPEETNSGSLATVVTNDPIKTTHRAIAVNEGTRLLNADGQVLYKVGGFEFGPKVAATLKGAVAGVVLVALGLAIEYAVRKDESLFMMLAHSKNAGIPALITGTVVLSATAAGLFTGLHAGLSKCVPVMQSEAAYESIGQTSHF